MLQSATYVITLQVQRNKGRQPLVFRLCVQHDRQQQAKQHDDVLAYLEKAYSTSVASYRPKGM